MHTEENKAVIQRYADALNGDLNGLDKVMLNAGNAKRTISARRVAFPDFQVQIDDMLAIGDKVVARYTFSGTHEGIFTSQQISNFAPTHKHVSFSGVWIYQIADGRITNIEGVSDNLGLLEQLGVGFTA